MKFLDVLQVFRRMGPRVAAFRAVYEFRRRRGWLKHAFPTELPTAGGLTLAVWKKRVEELFLFGGRAGLSFPRMPSPMLRERAERILRGEVPFFGASWVDADRVAGWTRHPETGADWGAAKHWTEFESLDPAAGDIKAIWERARFSHWLTVMRADYHAGEDHAEAVIAEILDFIARNPLNRGPNYVCSQEISIRLMNWLFLLAFYADSPQWTEERFATVVQSLHGQLRHVAANIAFSRIAVRNNHAITECAMLYIAGLLFPEFPESNGWLRNGRRWLLREVAWQIAPDGTHLQHSTNYQRVVVQVLTLVLAVADRFGDVLPPVFHERFRKAVEFLFRCQDARTGCLPNYGANDGALFFPLDDADFRDYRPQLDAAWAVATGQNLYGAPLEDRFWFGGAGVRRGEVELAPQDGLFRFPDGGVYVLRDASTLSLLKCAAYRNKRPGHADGLHLDLWVDGRNVLFDGGSYLYNTAPEWARYFSGTESHNTVMLGTADQMRKGPRFLWLDWTDRAAFSAEETEQEWVLRGEIHTFTALGRNIVHRRIVRKTKGVARWTVTDTLDGLPAGAVPVRQIWHCRAEDGVRFQSTGRESRTTGWVSDYYGIKMTAEQPEFHSDGAPIVTEIFVE